MSKYFGLYNCKKRPRGFGEGSLTFRGHYGGRGGRGGIPLHLDYIFLCFQLLNRRGCLSCFVDNIYLFCISTLQKKIVFSYLVLYFTRYCPTLDFIVLPYSTLSYFTLHCPTLLYIVKVYSSLSYLTLHCTTLLYIVLPNSTLSYFTLHCPTLLYIVLLYSTLSFSTLYISPYPKTVEQLLSYPTLSYSITLISISLYIKLLGLLTLFFLLYLSLFCSYPTFLHLVLLS